jgi:hypothetical protein
MKTMAQNIDPLALYAGLNITYTEKSVHASLYNAISLFFDKLENCVSNIQLQI